MAVCGAVVVFVHLLEYVRMHRGRSGQTREHIPARDVPSKCRWQFSIWHLLVATTLLGVVLPLAVTFARRMMAEQQLRTRVDAVNSAISRLSVGSYESGRRVESEDLADCAPHELSTANESDWGREGADDCSSVRDSEAGDSGPTRNFGRGSPDKN